LTPPPRRELAAGFGLIALVVVTYGLVATGETGSGSAAAGKVYAGTVPVFAHNGQVSVCHAPFHACAENGPVIDGLRPDSLPERDLTPPDETDDAPPSKQGVALRLTVRVAGDHLVLVEPPAIPVEAGDRFHFGSPCPEPAGGWAVSDPVRTGNKARLALEAYLTAEAELARVWWDTNAAPEPGVLNVAFTGDLNRHRSEIAAIWGGPHCVSSGTRSIAELRSAAARLSDHAGSLPGGPDEPPRLATCCGVDRERGAVSLFSVVHDEAVDDWIERWAGGVPVHVDAYLEPVDGA
jgi:hypothetical protein